MTETTTDPLRIRGPRDLIAAVPYLLGFNPSDSLVLIGMAGHRVIVTARTDLADARTDDTLITTLAAFLRGGATDVVAVVFSNPGAREAGHGLPESDTVLSLGLRAEQAGLGVTDVLLVCDGRWWSYLCDNSECRPPQGNPLADDERVAAECVHLGMAPHDSRRALVATLDTEPNTGRLLDVITDATAKLWTASEANSAKRAVFAAARREEFDLSDAELVRFALTLTQIDIRDAVWTAIDGGRLPKRGLWHTLARRLPAPYNAAPLFLYGWSALRSGEGILAGVAAQRAVEADPSYSAADLLLAAVARGVNPSVFPKLRLPRTTTTSKEIS